MTEEPTLTVVVPTHARPTSLHRCLDALAQVRPPSGDGGSPLNFEVVVVVDGHGPGRDDLEVPSGLDLQLVQRPHSGPAATRNHGARVARGRWLAFLDDDCAPRPDWLQALHARLLADPGALVGGWTINALTGDLFAETTQLMVDELVRWEIDEVGHTGFLPSCNLAVARDAFLDLGGFDEDFPLPAGEDRDFCDRWRAGGGVAIFAPEAVVEHRHDMTLGSFWRQHYRYGRGARQLLKRRIARSEGDARLETSRFKRRLLKAPFERYSRGRALGIAARMMLAQIATATGFLREALARKTSRGT